MDGAVPGRVTEMPATAQPKRTASSGAMPRDSPTAKPPLNASPAPVVSTTEPTLNGGTSLVPAFECSSAPFSPSVMTAAPTPMSMSFCAAAFASASVSTLIPVSPAASVSFGVT
jgi:hypothetical protein